MEKASQINTIYKSASVNEAALLAAISDSGLAAFSASDARAISGWPRDRVANTLASLSRKGLVARLIRGRFALADGLEGRAMEVALALAAPAYVSFWTALSMRGLTEQQPSAIQLVSTRQSPPFAVAGRKVEVARFRPSRFFGYDSAGVATAEKALVDSLHIPSKCGGLEEVVSCLREAKGRVGARVLSKAIVEFGDRSLASRAGYLARETGFGELHLGRLRSEVYVKLDASAGKPFAYDKEWHVAVNWRVR